jgi:hypothetical protein
MVSIDNPVADLRSIKHRGAVLDDAHIGHINGAMGTIVHSDIAPRLGWRARLKTLLAILGPGLIVMVGDNDAGVFGTYTQAGQNYGTTLMWTLMLLIPVLYVNQEMVVRRGAVTGVGHARPILERFGRFWGAFSVIDLLLLNALTIVTELIGVTLALNYQRPQRNHRFAHLQPATERRPAMHKVDCRGPPLQARAAAAH